MKFREVFDGRLGSSNTFFILQRIQNQSRPVINVLLNSWMSMLTKTKKKTFLWLKDKTKLIFRYVLGAFLTLRYESPIISQAFHFPQTVIFYRVGTQFSINTCVSMGRTITLPGGCIQGSPSICTGISDFNLMLI